MIYLLNINDIKTEDIYWILKTTFEKDIFKIFDLRDKTIDYENYVKLRIKLGTFVYKKYEKKTKDFIIKIYSENRENHTIEIPFCFIPIFQSVAEI